VKAGLHRGWGKVSNGGERGSDGAAVQQEIWPWDITKLRSADRGEYYELYIIIGPLRHRRRDPTPSTPRPSTPPSPPTPIDSAARGRTHPSCPPPPR